MINSIKYISDKKIREEIILNEILFNALFNRPIHNIDFLRARVASCIKPINDEITNINKGDYNSKFYVATTKFNDTLIENFGLQFLSSTLTDLSDFKNFLFKIFNSKNVLLDLKENDYINFLANYHTLVKHVGYLTRSRILRRYKNFVKISNNFIREKIPEKDYKKEILNHIIFFDDMLKKFQDAKPNDICIYYFAYDIRASENVRKLKSQIEKISLI